MSENLEDTIERLLAGVTARHQQLRREAADGDVGGQEPLEAFEEQLRQFRREVVEFDPNRLRNVLLWLRETSLEE